MHGPSPAGEGAGLSAARVEALGDCVFSIIMTLLVLDLRVPKLPPGAPPWLLAREVMRVWPQALSFVMSFISLGTLWVAHRIAFHYILRTDRPLIWMNIGFLMFLSLIPFLTSLIGQYPTYTLPLVLYGADLIAAVLMLYWMWRYASSDERLVSKQLRPELVRAGSRRLLIAPAVYSVAIACAFFNPWVSVAVYVMTPLAYALPGALDRHWFGQSK